MKICQLDIVYTKNGHVDTNTNANGIWTEKNTQLPEMP